MDWFMSVQKQAQEAAEVARQLAEKASQQAAALAREASEKAQEVAKEALAEAQKSLLGTAQEEQESDPLQLCITPDLEQFVRSLTYSTFSEYPQDSLDLPPDPADQKLTRWQERHARLVLQQVPQLQDLRFVLCPKCMDEYIFWMVYFTLSKRYLPAEAQEQQEALPAPPSSAHTPPAAAAAAAVGAAGAAAGLLPRSSSSQQVAEDHPADQPSSRSSAAGAAGSGQAAAAADADAAAGADAAAAGDGVDVDAELAALADDPELDAYLQDALALDGAGGGSELEDLDDYINQLDAEVNSGNKS